MNTSMSVIHRDVHSPGSESVFSMFILRDDTSSQVPDNFSRRMVPSKQPAFLAIHGGSHEFPSRATSRKPSINSAPSSSRSLRLPRLSPSPELRTVKTPKPNPLITRPSSDPSRPRPSYGERQNFLLDEILAARNKDLSRRKDEHARTIDELNKARQRLAEEEKRLRNRQRHLQATPPRTGHSDISSPDWGEPKEPTETEKFIRETEKKLPDELKKYQRMKDKHRADVERLRKPYSGELGPQSYKAGQMKDYYMVRGLVEGMVDGVLDGVFQAPVTPAPSLVGVGQRDREKRKREDEERIIQLLMEEIVLEETRESAREVAVEFTALQDFINNKTKLMYMNTVEMVALGSDAPRNPDNPDYNLVTKTYLSQVSDRDRSRPDIWRHRQVTQLRGKQTSATDKDDDDDDAELLHFHDIIPLDLRQIEPRVGENYRRRRRKDMFLRYMRREVLYWKAMSVTVQEFSLSSRCHGPQTVQVSPSQCFIAVGTKHGDVLVVDLRCDPLVAVRAVHNSSPGDDAVVDVNWSLDSSNLITVNSSGGIQVWSMNSGGVLKADNKSLALKTDGVVAEQLAQRLVLDPEELRLQQGSESEQQLPVRAVFSPSLSLAASQTVVCVAVDGGDVLRCDLSRRLHTDLPPPTILNPTMKSEARLDVGAQDTETELFRAHKHTIIFLGFIGHLGDMVTVDTKGYINRWKYNRQQLSSYDWYQPEKKCRLDLAKTMYSPVDDSKPNIIFTERSQNGRQRKRSAEQIQRDRLRVERDLDQLDLGDPWHQDIIPDQLLITQVFAPREKIPDSGSVFHIVVRHAITEHLSTYMTRIYRPVKVASTKLLCCTQTPDGSALIFLLLFPEYPPKEAHISVVILELATMSLRNWRRDIDIEDNALYQQLVQHDYVSCDVSRVYGTTGAVYLFMNVAGHLSVYSLNTGLKVLRTEDPTTTVDDGFDGCRISCRGVWMSPLSQLRVTTTDNRILLMSYSSEQSGKKGADQIHLLDIRDDNEKEERTMMYKSYQMWRKNHVLPRSEMRIDSINFMLEDDQPIEVFVRGVVMDIIDDVIQSRYQGYSTQQIDAFDSGDRQRHYSELVREWGIGNNITDQSGPATLPSRQSSSKAPPTTR